MEHSLSTPQPIGGAHAHAPIIGMEVRYAAKIDQVCVDFATYDGAQVFSIQLTAEAALDLSDQLEDAANSAIEARMKPITLPELRDKIAEQTGIDQHGNDVSIPSGDRFDS